MADVAQQEVETTKQGGSNKLLIIISAVLFLILIGGGAMAYMMLNSDDEVIEEANQVKTSKIVQNKKVAGAGASARNNDFTQVGPMFALDKFIVNLSSDGGSRYLRTAINLELSSEEFQAEVEKKKPLIRDIIIRTLSAKSYEEISTIRGKETLKDEIVTELNKIFTDGSVQNIFFTEFVVQ